MDRITPHRALIFTMVIASAIDAEMTDPELVRIGQLVERMPAFDEYDPDDLVADAEACAELLAGEDGIETVMRNLREALPSGLHETAYAFACEIVAADRHANQEELRFLEVLADELKLDPLAVAAIRRGVRARHMKL